VGFKKDSQLVTMTQQQLEDFAQAVASATASKLLAGLRADGRLRPAVGSTLMLGPLVVDLAAYEAAIDSRPLVMQPQQFRVLIALAKHAGQVLSRDQLMEMAFDDPGAADARGVDVAILRLRRAFGGHAGMLQTVHGVGYKLVPDGVAAGD
jgi:DNA-binding response OmpR family regulator